MIRHMLTAGVQGIDHAAGIDRVPVNDGGDNQVEGGGPDREIFLAAIAEAAEAMEIDGPYKAVAAALLQRIRSWAKERW